MKNKGGRPTKVTEGVLAKLTHAFAMDATVLEACHYADIDQSTLQRYFKKEPEFRKRVEGLRSEPVMKARTTIVSGLQKPDNAKWYLEKKRRKEFGREEIPQAPTIYVDKMVINAFDKVYGEPRSIGTTTSQGGGLPEGSGMEPSDDGIRSAEVAVEVPRSSKKSG